MVGCVLWGISQLLSLRSQHWPCNTFCYIYFLELSTQMEIYKKVIQTATRSSSTKSLHKPLVWRLPCGCHPSDGQGVRRWSPSMFNSTPTPWEICWPNKSLASLSTANRVFHISKLGFSWKVQPPHAAAFLIFRAHLEEESILPRNSTTIAFLPHSVRTPQLEAEGSGLPNQHSQHAAEPTSLWCLA